MAVFVSASDESDGGKVRTTFWHGGWVMQEPDWIQYFVPAWQERILDAHPAIPFLHMTDIRNPEWRQEHGLSWLQAQDKLDEAAAIIDTMGSLYPLATNMSGGVFLDAHGKKKVVENVARTRGARFLPDHFAFNTYVFSVLKYVHTKHPGTEKVDFEVEHKKGVFEKMKQYYDCFAESLLELGAPELAKYLGKLIPGGKERVPLQAADMLCWHASRAELGTLRGRDLNRAATLLKRKGQCIELPDAIHHDLAHAFVEKMNENDLAAPPSRLPLRAKVGASAGRLRIARHSQCRG